MLHYLNINLLFSDLSLEKFIFDLNELFMGTEAAKEVFIYASLSLLGLFSFIAGIMSIVKLFEYIKGKPKVAPRKKENVSTQKDDMDVDIEVGEFGKVVSDSKINIKGEQLDYFILKNNKYEQDSLPIGTVVVLLKRSKKEAYVKAASKKDLQSLEAKGIKI